MSDDGKQPTDDEIRAAARELVKSRGAKHAARELGVSRDTALGLAADAPVRASTFALIREKRGVRCD